jgi:hypothetical protein
VATPGVTVPDADQRQLRTGLSRLAARIETYKTNLTSPTSRSSASVLDGGHALLVSRQSRFAHCGNEGRTIGPSSALCPARSRRQRLEIDANGNGAGLAEAARRVAPTMLIGTSTAPGSFTEAIFTDTADRTERPIIFALYHPFGRFEANPADLIASTDGRGLIATGTPFAPVTYKGITYVIAQVNNAMLYPGIALGAIVSKASRISNGMFAAAANAVYSLVTVRQSGASLLSHIDDKSKIDTFRALIYTQFNIEAFSRLTTPSATHAAVVVLMQCPQGELGLERGKSDGRKGSNDMEEGAGEKGSQKSFGHSNRMHSEITTQYHTSVR